MKPSESVSGVSQCGRYAVEIPKSAIQAMLKHCRNATPEETGGILIGHYSEDHVCAIVTQVTGPPSDSRRFSARFFRGVSGLQQLLNQLWSQHRGYYLGEWHFHPINNPRPSSVDRREMSHISRSEQYSCPEPLLVIVAGAPDGDWSISVTVQVGNQSVEIALKENCPDEMSPA